jgi:prophage regulatory protein
MQLYQWGNGMPRKILRLPVVLDRTGLSRSTVYLRVTEGRFPRPVSLGARAVGWIETEVEEWIARQIEVSREIREQRAVVSPLSSR